MREEPRWIDVWISMKELCMLSSDEGLRGAYAWYVDPSTKRHAVAIFDRSSMIWLGWVGAFTPVAGKPPQILGIEKPRVYPGVPNVDANDLIDVWGAACWLRSQLQRLNPNIIERIWEPSEWKRQTRKPVHHDRIWSHLTEYERGLFPEGTYEKIQRGVFTGKYRSEVHNLLDATGIGLFGEGRTGAAGKTIHHG
jgi:hypothetical protein